MTEVDVVTLPVVTENVAEVEPCGTVTDAGTLAAVEFELESDTTAPPEPAAEVRLTVPVPDWPADDRAGADRDAAERRRRRIHRHYKGLY